MCMQPTTSIHLNKDNILVIAVSAICAFLEKTKIQKATQMGYPGSKSR